MRMFAVIAALLLTASACSSKETQAMKLCEVLTQDSVTAALGTTGPVEFRQFPVEGFDVCDFTAGTVDVTARAGQDAPENGYASWLAKDSLPTVERTTANGNKSFVQAAPDHAAGG